MNNFSVKTNKLHSEADDIRAMSHSVSNIGEGVSEVYSTLNLNSYSAILIKRRLSIIHEKIIDEAAKMDSLSSALDTVSDLYMKAETNIMNGNFPEMYSTGAAVTENIATMITQWLNQVQERVRLILMELGLIDSQEQHRIPGQEVTASQQAEHDLYMQSEIARLRSNPRFSQSTWENASLEERKHILNEYISEASAVMGLEYNEINFEYHEPEGGYVINGSYSRYYDEIMLNEYVVMNSDSPNDIFSTTIHELRHAYQYEVCENPEKYVVTEATASAWQDSFNNYKSQEGFMRQGMSSSEAYQAYRNQAVESDARRFAKQF